MAKISSKAIASNSRQKGNEFTSSHCAFFKAKRGAFSKVTPTEADKQQITISGVENDLFEDHFGDKLFVGKKKDNPQAATQTLRSYATGKAISLTVHYRPPTPKGKKRELQLYSKGPSGFKPPANSIWFAFQKDGDALLNIGYMSAEQWSAISAAKAAADDTSDDELYQQAINASPAVQPLLTQQLKYPRNPIIANTVLKKQLWKCELDNTHSTFKSASSGSPFMEAHHLIPMGAQSNFGVSLDIAANIVCVCPNCHRMLHHAEQKVRAAHLRDLLATRQKMLSQAGINVTLKQLLSYYLPDSV